MVPKWPIFKALSALRGAKFAHLLMIQFLRHCCSINTSSHLPIQARCSRCSAFKPFDAHKMFSPLPSSLLLVSARCTCLSARALPAGSCRAAACAACASATALATRPHTVASCARRRVPACSGPFPLRRGIVLRALQCAASGGGQGAKTCDNCATDVGSLRCTWIHRRAAPAGPAWPCEGVCVPLMRRCSASSSVLRRGPAGGSGQGHAAT